MPKINTVAIRVGQQEAVLMLTVVFPVLRDTMNQTD
jgi:hypothetical protein